MRKNGVANFFLTNILRRLNTEEAFFRFFEGDKHFNQNLLFEVKKLKWEDF